MSSVSKSSYAGGIRLNNIPPILPQSIVLLDDWQITCKLPCSSNRASNY